MILLIVCTIIILALAATFFLKVPSKILVLSLCVILLVICNFINQIQAICDQQTIPPPSFSDQHKAIIQQLNRTILTTLNNNTSQSLSRQLLDEQREITNYLFKKWNSNENTIVYFTQLNRNRLTLILQLLEYRIHLMNADKQVQVYAINYNEYECDYSCWLKHAGNKNGHTVVIIENIEKTSDLKNIQRLYEQQNVTIILQNIPKHHQMHTISRLTEIYRFSNNYLPKILEQHLPKTIEICAQHHTFDYQFYMRSFKTSLSELCSRHLPSTATTKCLRKLISDEKESIPENWGRKCLLQRHNEGVIFDNGWISLKKQYFWGSKANTSDSSTAETDSDL